MEWNPSFAAIVAQIFFCRVWLSCNALYSWCRSPVRSPPRRRAYSRSASRSPRRRRRSVSPDRPSRVPRIVHSPARRSYSRSPIRRRKSPPTYRSPVRRRYPSRSPPARRSSSYSLSPVPRSWARLLLGMPVHERIKLGILSVLRI